MAQYGVFQYGSHQYGLGIPAGSTGAVLGHSINLDTFPAFVGTPTVKNTFNQFDEHGLMVSLKRNRGETNWEYKRRIYDVFIHRANSAYRGLINGITRELGLEFFTPIIINPKTSMATGQFFAPDPYILFDGVWVYLYSDYKNSTLDLKIDRFAEGGNFEHVGGLVDIINSQSTFFEAHLTAGQDPFARSMTILNQSNRVQVDDEQIESSTKFKIENSHIITNTLKFNDFNTFKTRVASEDLVNSVGDFYVDYSTGFVTTYTVPPLVAAVKYEYTEYPFMPVASPVILHDINSDNFKVKMFEQVLGDDGVYVHGIPTEIGVDIINELLTVVPMYWGV